MPVELGLEFMTPVSPDSLNAKRIFLNEVVRKFDGILLILARVNLERSHSRLVVDCRVLKTPDALPVLGLEAQNLRVCLDMMTPLGFRVSMGMDRPPTMVARQAAHFVAGKRS
jgi:hypothetical protein